MNKLVLYDLFTAVRDHKKGPSLGLDDYFRLLQLLDKGHPAYTFDELAFVCETLWIKSLDQREVLYEVFKKFRAVVETAYEAETSGTNPDPVSGNKDAKTGGASAPAEIDTRKEKQKDRKEPEVLTGARFSIGAGSSGSFALDLETPVEATAATIDIPYLFTHDYFPVTTRNLQQGWRNLKTGYEGPSGGNIDFKATIEKSAREGMVTHLMYAREALNKLDLFLFLDHEGSMVAFEAFGRELVKTALESEVHKKLAPYFFYNLPAYDEAKKEYVLLNEQHTVSKTIPQILKGSNKNDAVVLLFSDAGSLSGEYNSQRIKDTALFLDYLQQRTAYVSWLNPVPAERWTGTTAEAVRKLIPMFECTKNDFEKAISSLKGAALARMQKRK